MKEVVLRYRYRTIMTKIKSNLAQLFSFKKITVDYQVKKKIEKVNAKNGPVPNESYAFFYKNV